MKITLIEPFHTGSHAAWGEELAHFSKHDVSLLTLPGRHWKWRMHGGAITLAKEFIRDHSEPDLLLVSDMLDLTTFLALTRDKTAGVPTAIYFHENQLTYPWSDNDTDPAKKRDSHYMFINYSSALAADRLLFNSRYHMESFFNHLPDFLKSFPDHNELASIKTLYDKSSVLHLGLNLQELDKYRPPQKPNNVPLILWNHRWEYDKNPEEFFRAIYHLQEQGHPFQLAILGEHYKTVPKVFTEARERLNDHIVHFGYIESFSEYANWLWKADILPVTSVHDFFGASVVQGIYCGCTPLLPHRLAYPEHLPEETRGHYLYNNFDSLVNKLEGLILHCSQKEEILREHVKRYDWEVIIDLYDELFIGMHKA